MSGSVLLVCGGRTRALSEKQFVACWLILLGVAKGAAVPATLPAVFEELLHGGKKGASRKGTPKPARDDEEAGEKDDDEEEEKEKRRGGDEEEDEEDAWELDKQTYSKLRSMYRKKTEDGEAMPNAVAMKEFKRSGVDEQELRRVIRLVPRGQKGIVTEGQFIVVMFLLKKVMGGAKLPSALPAQLKKIL